MRDGTNLVADVYRPKTKSNVPVILYLTQYGKEAAQQQPSRFQSPDWFASHCYLVHRGPDAETDRAGRQRPG